MIYGTIKSEVWTHDGEVGQEYFRYMVITRWRPTEDKTGFQWTHTITRIRRDGEVIPIIDFETDNWWIHYSEYMKDQPTECPYDRYSEGRNWLVEQHRWIVRHCVA